jgi:hypothetical protein
MQTRTIFGDAEVQEEARAGVVHLDEFRRGKLAA